MSDAQRVGGPQETEARASLVVMKFGGTSVEDAKAMLRTAAIVRGRRERGLSPVVVVSAMAKVTDHAAGCGCGGRPRRQNRRAGDFGAAAEPAYRYGGSAAVRRAATPQLKRRSASGSIRWTICCAGLRRWAS